MEMAWVTELDGQAAADALVGNHAALVEAEAAEFVLAAHWADLHSGESLHRRRGSGRAAPGSERARRIGGDGTPLVAEFAAAELGCLLGRGHLSASNLMANALDVQLRLPRLWAAIKAGTARAYQCVEVAKATRAAGLSLEQARWVDAQVEGYLGGLAWGRFLALVEAKIIEADPEAAEARRRARALERFVATGQCNEYGLKTMVVKAEAGDVIFFVAMCDRVAAILRLNGDHDPVDVRRAKAIGILANPARAFALLQEYAATDATATPAAGTPDADPEADADPEVVGEGDVHPAHNDADDPQPQRHPCPTCAGSGSLVGDPTAFVRPMRVDPDRLLPPATLYVHISLDSFRTGTGGVARVENGIGPVTVEQAAAFLAHTHVTLKPVIDLADQMPVDAYETPTRLREVVHLLRPGCIYPYSANLARGKDLDHPVPYLPMDEGGPPGQTDPYRLGPMTRYGHRVKTHAPGWAHLNPLPGVYLWRTRHGYWHRVDRHGTHPLGKNPDLTAHGIHHTHDTRGVPARDHHDHAWEHDDHPWRHDITARQHPGGHSPPEQRLAALLPA